MLRKNLEAEELKARSSSFYLCPGYKQKRCNGRYTEEEAQQVVDHTTGLFLCQECSMNYEADPNAPPKEAYTLQLVDNSRHLKEAVDNLRRVTVQLSGKTIGNHQLRAGIYDLLQKVRGKGKSPITSNLPSENFALGIGSKRLAGTGRTAGIKARKLELQGIADSASSAKDYLVGGGDRSAEGSDLTFLKNAMGNEIAFTVEKGGGARANLLATKRRRRLKLLDAAASRVGASVPLYVALREKRKREEEELAEKEKKQGKKRKKKDQGHLEFLNDNIGRGTNEARRRQHLETLKEEDDIQENEDETSKEEEALTLDSDPEDLSEEVRQTAFQAHYKCEMNRQIKLLKLETEGSSAIGSPPKAPATVTSPPVVTDTEDNNVEWEDA